MKHNFLLNNETAKKLYQDIKDLPIIDCHCHLDIHEILENKPYENITKLWLYADHYKWRLMRTYGIEEHYITGDASDYEKFEKYIQALSYAIGSPLYHWSKMELSKYFDVDDEILPQNAADIYEKANQTIRQKELTPSKILEISNVERVCIIEDAQKADLSEYDEVKNLGLKTSISPVFRLDKLLLKSEIELKQIIPEYIKRFISVGCNSADIGIEFIGQDDNSTIEKISYLLNECYKNNFSVQLHFGAMRNNNKKMYELIGVDKGYDSISEQPYLTALVKIFNKVSQLGKTVIFNLNPSDNAKVVTFASNYVGDGIKGKVQLGTSWWFNDNKDGILEFFKTLSNHSLLCASIGMLTDSRSIISYVRHDYFRRLLCNYIGEISEKGEFTKEYEILNKIASDIAYYNVKNFI